MSRSIDLFVDSVRPLPELAAELARVTSLELAPEPDRPEWALDAGGVRAVLRAHPFADDGDLLLSRYRYALSAHVDTATRIAEAPETALLRMVADALHGEGVATLLVHDLQFRDHPAGTAAAGGDGPPAGDGDGRPAGGAGGEGRPAGGAGGDGGPADPVPA